MNFTHDGSIFFILDGHTPISCKNISEWQDWMTKTPFEQRVVKKTSVSGIQVSTIFTGFNKCLWEENPCIFETMILDEDIDFRLNSSTWTEAEQTHEAALVYLKLKIQ